MSRRPPEKHVYYLDANLDGPELTSALRRRNMPCERHRDHFAQDAEDETWIPAVAQKGWIIVTRDLAIRRRPAERAAWLAANAVVIMVRGEKLSGADLESILSAAYAGGRLDNFIAKRTRPMIVYLTRSGQLSVQEGGARRGGQKKG